MVEDHVPSVGGWIVFGGCILFLLIVAVYQRIIAAYRQCIQDDRASTIWVSLFLLYLMLSEVVGGLAFNWAISTYKCLFVTAPDKTIFDLMHQRCTMLGAGQAAVLSACSIFIPILSVLWSHGLEALKDKLQRYREQLKDNSTPKGKKKQLETGVSQLEKHEQNLLEFGPKTQPFFFGHIVMMAIALLAVAIGYVPWCAELSYLMAPLTGALGALLGVQTMFFMVAYLFIVQQPIALVTKSVEVRG